LEKQKKNQCTKIQILADSRFNKEQKEWEKLLYVLDSTTISLFDNILKGVGRHPKNNFDFSIEDLQEIYKRRWAIETLYKQLKQNFQLHFFYGDSVNAIQTQTWVVLIANLLCTVISHKIKRHCFFSQIVTIFATGKQKL
jgi:IS4 transposase